MEAVFADGAAVCSAMRASESASSPRGGQASAWRAVSRPAKRGARLDTRLPVQPSDRMSGPSASLQ